MASPISKKCNRINIFMKSFPAGLTIGVVLGIFINMLYQNNFSVISGILIGLVIEQFLLKVSDIWKIWQNTHPLRILLGPIAKKEDCYIFFSSYYRNPNSPAEYKLLQPNHREPYNEIIVKGPDYLLGEGDAQALAFIQNLLTLVPKDVLQIKVERENDQQLHWGENCFCIGTQSAKTRAILNNFPKKFFIFDENFTVITKPDLEVIDFHDYEMRKGVFIKDKDDGDAIDYGIILKLHDQYFQQKVIFVIAGIGPAGTSGAAYYLLIHYKELSKLGDEFGILIQVPNGYKSALQVDFDTEVQYYLGKKLKNDE